MEIRDLRHTGSREFSFDELEPGWVVQGVETGTVYYVCHHHGGSPGKRLVNFNRKAIQDKNHTGGRYRRLRNAVLEIRPE